MKLLLKITVFCVFTAIIALLFNFIAKPTENFDTSVLLQGNVDRLGEQIAAEWQPKTDWDNELYQRQMTKIEQSYSAGLIDRMARKTLYDRCNKEAYTKATGAMNGEFGKTGCNRKRLETNFDGLSTILEREPSVANIPTVKNVLDRYSLYRRIITFNEMSIGLTPKFDINTLSWAPRFEPYAANLTAKYNELCSSSFYPSLKHIDDVSRIHRTQSKIDEASRQYYRSLANQVENSFSREVSDACAGMGTNPSENVDDIRMKFQQFRANSYNSTPAEFARLLSDIYKRLF